MKRALLALTLLLSGCGTADTSGAADVGRADAGPTAQDSTPPPDAVAPDAQADMGPVDPPPDADPPAADMAPPDATPDDMGRLDAAVATPDMTVDAADSDTDMAIDAGPQPMLDMAIDAAPPEPDMAIDAGPQPMLDMALDAAPPEPDMAIDAAPPEPDMTIDAAPPEPDMALDAAPPEPDMALDAAPPEADMTLDAAPIEPDMAIDAAPPEADMAIDAAPPEPDMAIDDAAPPEADAAVADAAPLAPDEGPLARCDDEIQNGDETGVDCGGECAACPPEMVQVRPPVYDRALRNPMKGLTTNGVRVHEWATLSHVYVRWNELENDVSDGLDRIRRVTEEKFGGVAERNVKVIPRVYLHWSRDDQKYWPADMETDDYESVQFQERLVRLVARLGTVWNDDPRIAFIELGIFGKWGEHHTPTPTPAMQALAAQAFADAFPDKIVSVRHAWNQFQGHGFGEYWDSFSHYDQMWPHGQNVRQMNVDDQRFRSTYIGGETAYDWGGWEIQPGTTPTDSVADPVHRNFIINTIRWLHCTQLRWIHAYDVNDAAARAGAEEVHRAMGYRFLLHEIGFTPVVNDGQLRVTLDVRNEGAAPFYYDWPLEASLLDPETREVVWRGTFDEVDIRDWEGGEDWPDPEWVPREDHWSRFVAPNHWAQGPLAWDTPPPLHTVDHTFAIDVPAGTYVLALAILDPASQRPSLRFATDWYFNGGRHPVGHVSIGEAGGGPLADDMRFDDPWLDQSIRY